MADTSMYEAAGVKRSFEQLRAAAYGVRSAPLPLDRRSGPIAREFGVRHI